MGKATLAVMNVPVAERIEHIHVNMERARWIYRDLTVDSRDGLVYFKPDVYARDAKVLAALNGKFRFDAPDSMPEWYQR